MIDLVYPLGNSNWSHNELRYSLRSVEMYAPRVRRVFIVGNCPTWIKDVIHVPVRVGGGTVAGQLRAFREVIKHPELGKRFVYFNDDFLLLDRPQWKERWCLSDSPRRHIYFRRCYEAAVEYLANLGIGALDYELHVPMLMETACVREMLSCLPPQEMAFRTVYGNLYASGEPVAMDDVKIRGRQWPDPSWWCFSTDDVVVRTKEFQSWLAERYPQPSRWEL